MLAGSASGPGDLIYPAIKNRVEWGETESQIRGVINSIAQKFDRDESGLTAYTNGHDDWIQFQFSDGRLSEVRERHNRADRPPPFVDAYLAGLKATFGRNAVTSTDDARSCNAIWKTPKNTVKAVWREERLFVDIYYDPTDKTPLLAEGRQREVWAFYGPLEDKFGKEAALRKTAARFKITRDDVHKVLVNALERHSWRP
ncbi:MAG TPA: hypothetical protein VG227_01405 [Caulobacteraceae bacterium]|jgi:hypothetical protein|nr:hypothetical protein [Caulobacteraceae bacterium]